MRYSYDRTAVADDTEDLLRGFYDAKSRPPIEALDDLVKAYRKPLNEFVRRFDAQVAAGRTLAQREILVDDRILRARVLKYLLSNYGMESSLAAGLADQIAYGENR
jgi:hypothetical protein